MCPRSSAKMVGRSGRGPTMFISPRSTLSSWGISSSRYWRRKRPTGVIRGSFWVAHTAPVPCSASTRIVRNL